MPDLPSPAARRAASDDALSPPTEGDARVSVTVAIASMGRDTLARTLHSIAAQTLATPIELDVVVADDSRDGAAAALVEREAPAVAVRIVPVGAGNIATARNAALAEAGGDWIAFIDDDEWAEPTWIADLLAVAREHGADAVIGPVEAHYPNGTPDWMGRVGVFRKRPGPDGHPLDTGATSNALVRRAALGQLRFREEFGRTGGEDTDLFKRLHVAGRRIVAASRGLVSEHVPPERLTRGHLKRRYSRGGHTFARIMLEGHGPAAKASFYAQSLVKWVVATLASMVLRPFHPERSLSLALRSWLNGGKLLHALGRPAPRLY